MECSVVGGGVSRARNSSGTFSNAAIYCARRRGVHEPRSIDSSGGTRNRARK